MPPRVKITKEALLHAAIDIVRKDGMDAVNARSLAAVLGCSTQPIFSNYPNMDSLKDAVTACATSLYRERLVREMETDRWPTYKAMGMGYIAFAAEEPELFKLLFLSPKRQGSPDDRDWQAGVTRARENGVSDMAAGVFHTEMWIFVHGIASMIATGALSFETEQIGAMISDVYEGLRRRHTVGRKEEEQ